MGGALDDDAEHLVPVTGGRGELRDLVQKGELEELSLGVEGGHRQILETVEEGKAPLGPPRKLPSYPPEDQ